MISKISKTRIHNLLGTALLGVGAILAFSGVASAQPRHDGRGDGRDEKKEYRKSDRHDGKRDGSRDDRNGRHNSQHDHRDDRRDNRPDYRPNTNRPNYNQNRPNYNRPNYNRPNYNNRPGYYNGPVYNNRPNYNNGNWNNRNDYRTVTGTVTRVESSRRFEIRDNGRTYDVYASHLPRGLDRGDVVRVSGVRSGNNDLRDANVSIIRNR